MHACPYFYLMLIIMDQIQFQSIIYQMGQKLKQKSLYMAGTGIIIGLIALHIVTGVKGYNYFVDYVEPVGITAQVTYKTYQTRLIGLIVAALVTLITNGITMFLLIKDKTSFMLQHFAIVNLVVEAGICLIAGFSTYEEYLNRQFYKKYVPAIVSTWDATGFNTFWNLLQADTYITFAQVLLLIFFYAAVANHLNKSRIDSQMSNENNSGNYAKI